MVKVSWSLTILVVAIHRYSREKKNAKHAILSSTPSTQFYEASQARQARQFYEARHFMKHVKYAKHVI